MYYYIHVLATTQNGRRNRNLIFFFFSRDGVLIKIRKHNDAIPTALITGQGRHLSSVEGNNYLLN